VLLLHGCCCNCSSASDGSWWLLEEVVFCGGFVWWESGPRAFRFIVPSDSTTVGQSLRYCFALVRRHPRGVAPLRSIMGDAEEVVQDLIAF
jgi:hypothetical protein